MKRNLFNVKVLGGMLVSAAIALVSCSDDLQEGNIVGKNENQTKTELSSIRMAAFAGNQTRVIAANATEEAQSSGLSLVATITNPSKAEGFNFTKEEGGRWLSATCVYYNEATDTYYATYHMQGNNYNTTLDVPTAGAIQSFKVDAEGNVTVGDGFRASNPAEEDFDFNHLYFDKTDQRIIVAGHNVKGGKQDNTRAIVGMFDPETGTLKYKGVDTAEKEYDDNGKSLGYKDAGDVNCVIRANDIPTTQPGHEGEVYGWKIYFVATRKGLAVLHADAENLFQPYLTEEGTNYFIATPGSAKYVSPTGTGSYYGLLYLSEEHSGDVEYTTSSEARIAHLCVCTNSDNGLGHLQGWDSSVKLNPQEDIRNFYDQQKLPEVITPIDGKNTCTLLGGSGSDRYVALGVNGMYYKNQIAGEDVKKFGNRPVNCIAVDASTNGIRGYLYVANGSKLTILNNETLEEVASWNMPSKDEEGNEIASSANYVTVTKAQNGERTIAVAFGQEGVRIFKFNP